MTSPPILEAYFDRAESSSGLRWEGKVRQVVGSLVESDGPFGAVGEVCEISTDNGRHLAGEIVGFRGSTMLSMPLERPGGIRPGDRL
jgi:flagellum-specific ATP synthase